MKNSARTNLQFRLGGLFVAGLLFSPLLCAETQQLTVTNSWIREAPPNATVMAAYMQIDNRSDKDKTLLKLSSPAFEKIEMHRSEKRGDMMHMVPQDKVVIPAGQSVSFAPGGLHVMLINPNKRFRQGDKVVFKLSFADGESRKVTFDVKKRNDRDQGHHHEHHH